MIPPNPANKRPRITVLFSCIKCTISGLSKTPATTKKEEIVISNSKSVSLNPGNDCTMLGIDAATAVTDVNIRETDNSANLKTRELAFNFFPPIRIC